MRRTIILTLLTIAIGLSMQVTSAIAAAGSIRIVDSSMEPLTLHPHRSFDPDSDVIISQIYEGLVDYDCDGKLEPKLTVRWERKSPTHYRFWLREGVTFHDGEPFDAYAVLFSVTHQFQRVSPAANSWLFDSHIQAKVVDRYTVDLFTGQPDFRFPYVLPMFLKILPPRYFREVGDEGLARRPVGTGPYRFVKWIRGHCIQLEANRSYWRKGLPRIKEVTFLFLPQPQQVAALLDGRVDLVTKLRGNDILRVMAAQNTKVL